MHSDSVNRWLTLVANIGVLIGLVFVGLEVRNSSNAVIVQTSDSVVNGFNDYNYRIAMDPDIARIAYLGYREPDKLTDSESYRFTALLRGIMNQYGRVHDLYKAGMLEEQDWAKHAAQLSRIWKLPGVRLYYGNRSFDADDEFYRDVMRYETEIDDLNYTLGREQVDIE